MRRIVSAVTAFLSVSVSVSAPVAVSNSLLTLPLLLLLPIIGVSTLLYGCGGGKTPTSRGPHCDAGKVRISGSCKPVCETLEQCDFSEICSADGVCTQPVDGKLPPRISSIDGDGSLDGGSGTYGVHSDHHLASALVITGANLSNATLSLSLTDGSNLEDYNSALNGLLAQAGGSDLLQTFTLPEGLVSGKYLLTVSNQSGNASATVYVVQGEPGGRGAEGPTGPQGDTGSITVAGADKSMLFVDGTAGAAGSKVYYDKTTENLGIGISDPKARLEAMGNFTYQLSNVVTIVSGAAANTLSRSAGDFNDELEVGDHILVDAEEFIIDEIAVNGLSAFVHLASDTSGNTGITDPIGAGATNNHVDAIAYRATDLLSLRDQNGDEKVLVERSGKVKIMGYDKSIYLEIEDEPTPGIIDQINYPSMRIRNYAGSTTGHPAFFLGSAQGTKAAPEATIAGRALGTYIAEGHLGVDGDKGWVQAGRIEFIAEQTFAPGTTDTTNPRVDAGIATSLVFMTAKTSYGNGGLMKIDSDSVVTIGRAGQTTAKLNVPAIGVTKITQSAWVAVTNTTFKNNWINYSPSWPVGYMIDSMGFVHLRGLAKSGTIDAVLPVFTLPPELRPQYNHEFVVACAGSIPCEVIVRSNGDITVETGSASWTAFDGITFQAGE